jgi:hypothetical protein
MECNAGIILSAARAVLCGLTAAATVTAGPIGVANLHALALQSDAIVAGVVEQGLQSGRDVSLLLSVRRVLKGSVSGAITVKWTTPSPYNGSRDLKGMSGLFFLEKSQAGPWQLLPAMAGDAVLELAVLPAAMTPVAADLTYGDSAQIDEKLMLELAAAVENGPGNSFAVNFLTGLQMGSTPEVIRAYRRLSASSSAELSAYGNVALLKGGDAGVVSTLAKASFLKDGGPTGDAVANALCQYMNANAAAVAALGAMSASGPARVQICAATALRMIHTRETLPYLVRLLDSVNPDQRYEGVAGLASFANSGAIPWEPPLVTDGVATTRAPSPYKTDRTLENFPAIDTFHQGEAKYIGFWKAWWANVGSEIR